jgi:hypothetical protein
VFSVKCRLNFLAICGLCLEPVYGYFEPSVLSLSDRWPPMFCSPPAAAFRSNGIGVTASLEVAVDRYGSWLSVV